jgi:hypothetical protein
MRNAAIAALVLMLLLLGILVLIRRDLPPTLPNGPLFFKFESLEQVSPTNNLSVPGYAPASGQQGAWGVIHVSAIENGSVALANQLIAGGPIFYADDGPGGMTGQITGVFYGLQTTSPTTWTGGTIDLFWHPANATFIDSNCLSGTTCAPDAAAVGLFTAGTFLVRLKLASGIDPMTSRTFVLTNVPLITVPTPDASVNKVAFANVDSSMSGPWTTAMDADWFTTTWGTRDVRLMTTLRGQSTWSGTPAGAVGLRGADPIMVFTH